MMLFNGFNPLKAGRKPFMSIVTTLMTLSFNPLKAGRKPRTKFVGIGFLRGFNPLKAGRKLSCRNPQKSLLTVSIPSRRVGNFGPFADAHGFGGCFNPLKAGRKLDLDNFAGKAFDGFNPLKAGRKHAQTHN